MAGKFTLITGMWRRRKGTGNESYHYGKTKQPLKFLKAKTPEGVELVQEL